VAAIAGLNQHFARVFLTDPFAQIEVLNNGIHVGFRRLPQRNFVSQSEALALALPDLLALEGDGLHARGQIVPHQKRHRQGKYGSACRDRREQHGKKLRIYKML
jgi:hypothetical protein